MEVVKVIANNTGDHFLALNQELKVKKQNEKGHIWVDGIEKGTKEKIIEQILKSDEYNIVE